MRRLLLVFSPFLFSALSVAAGGQEPAPAAKPGGIAWFGTLESALGEAKRTGKPILLVSGAPHCHSISGIW